MRLVIADTGPVNYLVQIDCIDLLPRIFERVVLPAAVQTELSSPLAPPSVQLWIADSPAWLEIAQTPAVTLSTGIHKGEEAAIALAVTMHADLLLMDDRRACAQPNSKGFASPVRSACSILPLSAAWLILPVQSASWKAQVFGDLMRSCRRCSTNITGWTDRDRDPRESGHPRKTWAGGPVDWYLLVKADYYQPAPPCTRPGNNSYADVKSE